MWGKAVDSWTPRDKSGLSKVLDDESSTKVILEEEEEEFDSGESNIEVIDEEEEENEEGEGEYHKDKDFLVWIWYLDGLNEVTK